VEELPRRGFERDEIQVLSAGHRHESGVQALNAAMQARLNPGQGRPEVRHGDKVFRLGDRVVQLRNDYQRGALNGEVGRVTALSARERSLTVTFPDPSGDRQVAYSQEELGQLQLGYATTVHKAQGSEYRAVVVVLSSQHWLLLGRNLFYTAVTRAREMLCIVAPQRAVWQALRNAGRGVRYGRLAERIVTAYGGGER
jgi:exodeoxyribonuclease V alpha subunit